MPLPTYGAAPLAKTFMLVRILSLIAMVTIIGLTANFVSQIVSTNIEPPKEIVGTLSVTSLAALYTLLSLPFFCAQGSLTLLVLTAIDALLLLAFTIISVLLGRPLSYMNCMAIGSASEAASAQNAYEFTTALMGNVRAGATGIGGLAGTTRVNCFETKAIWGCCVGCAVLFATSCIVLPVLWWKARRAGRASEKGGA
nr:hypothetical protein B0A51_08563 [Rachicladosporium sp. CCFEE 5018]